MKLKSILLAILMAFQFAIVNNVSAQQINSRMGGLALSNDQPIQIESDRLDIDDSSSSAIFSGNVKVVQGDTLLQSRKMTVFYASGGSVTSGATDIQKIAVSGKVFLKSDTQTATADNGIFNMKSQTLNLSGNVVMTEGENVFTGCKLTVNMESGDARLDSCGKRVIIQLDPKSKPK